MSFELAAKTVEKVSTDVGKNKKFNPDKRAEKVDIKNREAGKRFDPDKRAEKKEKKENIFPERMEKTIEIKFKCPQGLSKAEFKKQLAAQEKGLNKQSIKENMDNREAYEQRKAETGNGRDVEGKKAQEYTRQKALMSRIESNQEKGMSYSEAKFEAEEWIKKQAALHDPDQVAGGNPAKVSRMGDAGVNSSIGSQWRSRVNQLKDGINEYAKGKSAEELSHTKLNVKLIMED